MMRSAGLRFAAGLIGLVAGVITFVIGVLLLLFGGVLAAISSTSGSLAGSGGLLVLFSLIAIALSAGFFVVPWAKASALALAVTTALVLWAFARIGAVGISLLVVVPFCVAVLCGLVAASDGAAKQPGNERFE